MGGISINAGFVLGSAQPIDSRFYLTKQQMKDINENVMPSSYFAICPEDSSLYIYSSTNTVDPTTGKFRKFEGGATGDFLEKVVTLPSVSENIGEVLCYIGETNTDYTKGQAYVAESKEFNVEEELSQIYELGDTNSDYVLSAYSNYRNPVANDNVFVKIDIDSNTYYYKDVLVESTTDNRLYPSTKVDDNDYLVAEYVGSSFYNNIQLLDWYPAVDLTKILDALNKKISIILNLPSEPATITDYNEGKSFYVIKDGVYPSTVKGHQLYHANYKLTTAPTTIKYDYWTSGEYYEYMFESDKTIEVGDTVYLVNSSGETKQLSRDVIVEVNDEYLAPSSMTNNSDGYIDKGDSPYESSELGEVYMLDWVPMYDIDNKQDKLLFDKAFLPDAHKLVDNPVIVNQTGHTIVGVQQSFGKAIDLYAIDTAKGGENVTVYTDKLPITNENVWYDYIEANDYYSQNPDFVTAGRYYSGNGWATYTRNTSKDTTTTSLFKYLDVDDKNVEKLSDLLISDRKIDNYIKNSPYIVSNKESELFGKTVALQSTTETGTWYEWSASTNKVYTKTPTIEVGTECWFAGNTDFNKSGLFIKDVLVESYYSHTNPTLEPSTEYGYSNSWEIATTDTPVEKSDYTINYAVWVDTNADSSGSGTLTEDIEFNIKVGGWEVGDIAHAGMTQQAFNERLAHEYKEPTLTFTTTSAKLIKKGTSLTAPTVTATSTKVDLDIIKTAIVFGGVDVETSDVSTGATINYTFAEDLTEDTTITATVTDAKKTKSAEIKFEFIDPFYWGESATNVLDQAAIEALTMDLNKKGTGKKYTYPVTSAASYLVIAYPSSYGVLKKIEDQNKFDNTPDWSRSTVVFNEGESDEVSYYVYVTSDKKTLNAPFFYTFTF